MFYRINELDYSEMRPGEEYFSDNQEYSVRINILIPWNNDNEYYIMGRLIKTEYIKWREMQILSDKNQKIIYWKKVNGNNIPEKIYVNWINDKTVQIEDKILNIFWNRYDYRREYLLLGLIH